jgi:transposase
MTKVTLSKDQLAELERAARRHPDAHVRSRAMAVRAVAIGHTRQEVAKLLPFSSYTIGKWVRGYAAEGLGAFAITPGRGRPSKVNEEEVLACLRISPERYGLADSRWTLGALGQVCPSLKGMSKQGILEVLHRLGFHYKRGQPWIHSPDPAYTEKKTPLKLPMPKPGKPPRR